MRISSIEWARTLAILAVIVIHISPFASPFDPALWPEPHYQMLAGFFNQISRFAVPFFFVTAGYFLYPKWRCGNVARMTWHYVRPLLVLWVLWSVVYVLLPMNLKQWAAEGYAAGVSANWQWVSSDPLNQWWVGGMVHLWFLPALVLAIVICALLEAASRPSWALVIGCVLYVLALYGGSYAIPFQGTEWALMTRNGPFFSLLFVALGIAWRRHEWQLSLSLSWSLLLGGIALYAAEVILLKAGFNVAPGRHDFLMGSLPWTMGLFGVLLHYPQWGEGRWFTRLAPDVLGIYCLHMLWVIWLMPLFQMLHSPLMEVIKAPLVLVLAVMSVRLLKEVPVLSLLVSTRQHRREILVKM